MRILLVHSFLYPEHGGDSVYTLRLANLLGRHGHDVGLWGMRDERNIAHRLSDYEVSRIDYRRLDRHKSLASGLRVASRAIYSSHARGRLAELLAHWRPDVVHLQSIHYHLTTSIVRELAARNIPIVWTQHNFATVCCNYLFHDGTICERCKPSRYYSPLLTRCKKNSLGASAVGSLQLAFDRWSGTYGHIDTFVAISHFFREKLSEFGIDERRIEVVPNPFAVPDDVVVEQVGDRLLYFGRLSEEKGLRCLIQAIGQSPSDVGLDVVGDGPQRAELEALAESRAPGRVRFHGSQSGRELERSIRDCRFTVTPSVCYENFPNTVVESFIRARPVIGAAIGGIPELVTEGRTGLLFRPGDADDLARTIRRAFDGVDAGALGRQARAFALEELSPETHYQRLIEIYQRHASPVAAAS